MRRWYHNRSRLLISSSEIEDCCQPWTFPLDDFDYVHIRYLLGAIVDWTALYREAFAVLKPGGYLESHEGSAIAHCDDNSTPPTSAVSQWGDLFNEGGKVAGRSFTVATDGTQRKAMEEAGFVDVRVKYFKARETLNSNDFCVYTKAYTHSPLPTSEDPQCSSMACVE